jgi:hypothetical protein
MQVRQRVQEELLKAFYCSIFSFLDEISEEVRRSSASFPEGPKSNILEGTISLKGQSVNKVILFFCHIFSFQNADFDFQGRSVRSSAKEPPGDPWRKGNPPDNGGA